MPQMIRQAAVLAIREGLVCLVTSRDGHRWVIPKGHVDEGQTPEEAAAREAWEEAGLRGYLEAEPMGHYSYKKRNRRHAVTVFRMDAPVDHDLWPERLVRQREWVTIDEAILRITDDGLREMLATVDVAEISYAVAGG
jgi:8-oxo-dGTP pyrophosphatase MutT (NUDIX family)